MSIKIKEITKIYGRQKALDKLSFEVNEGEIVGLLGPNGAGKSTLMKILTGYILPDSGRAEINGKDCVEHSLEVKRNLGYLPESNPLYEDMYIAEYLEFVAGVFHLKDRKQRVEEIIEKTGLTKERHKKIGALSKGYRQRVGLAQAFIHNPKVLILDEPTSGLDPNQLIEIRSLIREIGKDKTVLFSSHIMQEVEALCDRVVIINNGRLIADSPTAELQKLWKDKEVITVEFKEAVDVEKIQSIKGVASVKRQDKLFKITAESGSGIREAIYAFSTRNQLTLIELKAEELKLEDIFHRLTQ